MSFIASRILVPLGVVGAFFGYFQMAKTMPINADGASNALQAWEMLHGNPLLSGWTVTDVSFYTTELIQYALIEAVLGLHENVFRVAAAMTYALLVVLAAALAKGDATGRPALVRMGVAVAIIMLPLPGVSYLVVFGGPNHLGTGVPLLLMWLVLDRGKDARWVPFAMAVLLAWGQIADPLVFYIGAIPLALVSAYRLIRARTYRGPDAHLLLAAAASVLLGRGALAVISALGGFSTHAPPTQFAPLTDWPEHLRLLAVVTAANFGGYLPDADDPVHFAAAIVRLAGLGLVLAAVVATLVALLRRPLGNRVTQILALAIVLNLAAFVASTLPTDLMSVRQVSVVLPLGAALAGRVCADWLAERKAALVLSPVLVFFTALFVWQAAAPACVDPKRDLVAWLESERLSHGIGGYWNASDLSLISGGDLLVAPVIQGDEIKSYRWGSRAQWYDPQQHDARFVVIDTSGAGRRTVDAALRQFGQPVQRRDFAHFAVLVYGHNLLVGLPAYCVPEHAASMAQCPPLSAVESQLLKSLAPGEARPG
ncbi:hypothetical protein [Allorhizocola rhizosphaerae]|uniref:hypothetical protein n=1 Tax=Allorhizocola rhizosphaerae TaxID=1872709 RepID=UPI000E3BE941|nr:hypothetical protein [Allorhizocola rhizosphaerae]